MENLALNKLATASNIKFPYTPSKAVDGVLDPFNRWQSNIVPCWLNVDLGISSSVNRWVIRHLPIVGWQAPDYVNTEFQLQASNDNLSWIEVDTVINNTTSIIDHSFKTCKARFFRVFITKGFKTNQHTASIVEFELYHAPQDSD